METQSTYLTAILADDEISILRELENAIDWAGLGIQLVRLATNGQDALGAILEFRPDFAIIDIKMPDLDGIEVIQKTRKLGITTDFIILSGYDSFSYAKDAIRYGAKAYLLKPLDNSELYDAIYRTCLDRSQQNKGNHSRLYREKLNLNFLNRLLDSKILEQNMIGQLLQNTGITISDSPCYVCVLLYEQKDQPLPYQQLILCLDEEFSQEKHIFWKHGENQIVGILNTSDSLPFQNAIKCQTAIRKQELPMPLIGIGDVVSGLMECSYSYNRALTSITYRLYDDTSGIFAYEILCTVQPVLKLTDIDYLPLVQFIVQKDLENIRTFCNDFIDRLLYVPMPPPNYVFSMCYSLFHMIEQEFTSFSHQEIPSEVNAQDLYRLTKLSQIREWMRDSFCHLSEFIDAVYGYGGSKYTKPPQSGAESDDTIIQKAKEFIHQNITSHIKIEDIAQQVHLSPSYFAIYFKNKTNINLRDYLLTEKMEYARRALMNPNTSINEVSYNIGYGDYRSFSRAFKNVHGITPSDFQAKYTDRTPKE
ncbi:MAG: response regulator [Lachnospiraceae bacterium]